MDVARALGMPNTTLRRVYPEICAWIAAGRGPAEGGKEDSAYTKLLQDNAILRRANRELTEHLDIAVANLQRLSMENHQLRCELESATKVTRPPRSR